MREYSMMLENLHLTDVNPRICGWEDCDPGHSYGPAVRDYLLLHYVRAGQGVFHVDGQSHPVGKGQMFVIQPHQVTRYQADSREPWRYSWIGFTTGLTLPDCLSQPVVEAAHCDHIFRSLLHDQGREGGGELYVCAKIYELLALLTVGEEREKSQANPYVSRALNYLHSSYMEDITVEGLARRLGLDRSYFCRIFRAAVGQPPTAYLVALRLERAAELLAQRGYSPAEAAAACGYSDPVNFSRIFKRQFGVPPSRYRASRASSSFGV